MEVVEDVLFALEHPVLVPALAVFAAAPQVRKREESSGLDPRGRAGHVLRRARDVEAAVTVEHRRHGPGRGHVSPVHEEHRHFRAVLRRVRRLLDDDGVGVQTHGRRQANELAQRAAARVHDVRDRWNGERLELEADEVAGVVAAHELDHPEAGERDLAVVAAIIGPEIHA